MPIRLETPMLSAGVLGGLRRELTFFLGMALFARTQFDNVDLATPYSVDTRRRL